jgi:hypothetical protein
MSVLLLTFHVIHVNKYILGNFCGRLQLFAAIVNFTFMVVAYV